MEMNDFNRPEGNDEAEGVENKTVIDEDDLIDPLDQTVNELDEVKTSSFREENKDDNYRRRKRQTGELRKYEKFDIIKGEFARRLLGSENQIDLNDGKKSR